MAEIPPVTPNRPVYWRRWEARDIIALVAVGPVAAVLGITTVYGIVVSYSESVYKIIVSCVLSLTWIATIGYFGGNRVRGRR